MYSAKPHFGMRTRLVTAPSDVGTATVDIEKVRRRNMDYLAKTNDEEIIFKITRITNVRIS